MTSTPPTPRLRKIAGKNWNQEDGTLLGLLTCPVAFYSVASLGVFYSSPRSRETTSYFFLGILYIRTGTHTMRKGEFKGIWHLAFYAKRGKKGNWENKSVGRPAVKQIRVGTPHDVKLGFVEAIRGSSHVLGKRTERNPSVLRRS